MSMWKDEIKSPPPPPPPPTSPPPPPPPPPPPTQSPPDKKFNGIVDKSEHFNTLTRNIDEKLSKNEGMLKKNYFKNFFKTASSTSSSISSAVSSIVHEIPLKMASINNTFKSSNTNGNPCVHGSVMGVGDAGSLNATAAGSDDRRNYVNNNCEIVGNKFNKSGKNLLEVPIMKIENNNNSNSNLLVKKSDNNNLSKELCSENNNIKNMMLNYDDDNSDDSNKTDKLENENDIELDRDLGSFVLPRVILKQGWVDLCSFNLRDASTLSVTSSNRIIRFEITLIAIMGLHFVSHSFIRPGKLKQHSKTFNHIINSLYMWIAEW